MSAIQTNVTGRLHRELRRPQVFTLLVSILTVVMVFVGLFEFIPAWILKNPPDQPHLWHIAELSALAVLLGGCMLGLRIMPNMQPPSRTARADSSAMCHRCGWSGGFLNIQAGMNSNRPTNTITTVSTETRILKSCGRRTSR